MELPAFFRALADACEANGGKLPDVFPTQPEKRKNRKKKVGVTGNPLAVHHAKRILYGNRH